MADVLGAFASFSDSAAGAAAKSAAGAQLGAWGVPQDLNPLLPPPTTPVPAGQPTANVPKEDQQKQAGLMATLAGYWAQYRNAILVVVGLGLVVVLVFKRKKK